MPQTVRFFLCLICLGILGFSAYSFLPSDWLNRIDPARPPSRPIENDVELQIALARVGFSPGSIDGTIGRQTEQAIASYQKSQGLAVTGQFDEPTKQILQITPPVYSDLKIHETDLALIDPAPTSWKERGVRTRMAYNSLLEMIAEQSMSDPDFIAALNPEINWAAPKAGIKVRTPNVPPIRIKELADHLRISLSQRTLQAFNKQGQIIFHCPVSIARRIDKRPSGKLEVTVRVENPNYTFNPAILSQTAANEGITDKFMIQPGPNNPVGTVWIGLNLPSYGIHGTPVPEKVGRTESSGCFRLANWNAEALLQVVEVGTEVYVEP